MSMPIPVGIEFRNGSGDEMVFAEIWTEDVYRMAAMPPPRQGQAALDLGANVGAWTLRALDAGVDLVVAVEPIPANVERLRKNLHDGRVLVQQLDTYKVEIVEAAVIGEYRVDGELLMQCGDKDSPSISYRVWPERELVGDALPVQALHIDEVLAMAASWWMMKVDVEGAEHSIFQDVNLSLLNRVDYIAMEFHGPGMGAHMAWIGGDWLGHLLVTLTEWGSVQTLGAASRGGMIYGWRNGVEAPHMWP